MSYDIELAGADDLTAWFITIKPVSGRGLVWFTRRYPSQGKRLRIITVPRSELNDILITLKIADMEYKDPTYQDGKKRC